MLITTFGFDEKKVLSAMRMLVYDKLVLITGEDSLEKDSYKHLVDIDPSSIDGMETVTVNVFSFTECLDKIEKVIDKYVAKKWDVILNVSGGTKVLSPAALLAAFHKGVRAYHCEEECIELPVILNASTEKILGEKHIGVLKKIKGEVERKELEEMLVEEGNTLSWVQSVIRKLNNLGILETRVEDEKLYLSVKESQRYFQDLFVD